MIRTAAFLLLFAIAADAGEKIVLVDGSEMVGARLVDASDGVVRIEHAGAELKIPASNIVAVREADKGVTPSTKPFNLYLTNGDRVRGVVSGKGETLALDSPTILGLTVPLDDVRAVRYGRLLGALQTKYSTVFERELGRAGDVIVVQRDTKPFPIRARVLSMGDTALTARVESTKRELAYGKIYGFVRTRDADPEPAAGVRVRVHLAGGGRVTIPLDAITAETVEGGGARIFRSAIVRLEFLGEHIAHLSDFDPIEVKETALFGEAPKWRRDAMVLGGPLRMDGHAYERGIGAQAYSRIEFVLGSRWNSLFVRCGIDDAAGQEGEATFRILGDGKVLRELVQRKGDKPASVTIDVDGVDRLVLETVPGESYISDFCDWADARVFNARKAHDKRK